MINTLKEIILRQPIEPKHPLNRKIPVIRHRHLLQPHVAVIPRHTTKPQLTIDPLTIEEVPQLPEPLHRDLPVLHAQQAIHLQTAVDHRLTELVQAEHTIRDHLPDRAVLHVARTLPADRQTTIQEAAIRQAGLPAVVILQVDLPAVVAAVPVPEAVLPAVAQEAILEEQLDREGNRPFDFSIKMLEHEKHPLYYSAPVYYYKYNGASI